MKKLLALLLALVMIFSLCACSSQDSDDDDDDERKPTKSKEKEEPEEEPEEDDVALGTIQGMTYESAYIGIGCELPDTWYFYNDEEIAEINGIAIDRVGEEAKEVLMNTSVVYDMYAQAEGGLGGINVNLEKVSRTLLKNIDVKKNMETILPSLISIYESAGYEDLNSYVTEVTVDGQTIPCIRTEATLYGMDVYLVQLQIPCSEHMAAVTISSFYEDLTGDYLDYLYFLD